MSQDSQGYGKTDYNHRAAAANLNSKLRARSSKLQLKIVLVISGNAKSLMHIYAGTRCTLMLFDVAALSRLQDRSDEAWRMMCNITESFARKCADLYQKVQLYGKKRIRSRIKYYLMGLDIEQGEVTLPMNRTALAACLGVDRTALARELGRMRQEGIIEIHKRRVRILDPDFLPRNTGGRK